MADARDRTYAELIVNDCLERRAGLAGARRRQSAGPAAARGAVWGDRRDAAPTHSCASRSRASCPVAPLGRGGADGAARQAGAALQPRARKADALVFVSAPDNTRSAAGDRDRADGHPAGCLPARHRPDDESRRAVGHLPVPDRRARAGGRARHRGVRGAALRRRAPRLGGRGRADAPRLGALRRGLRDPHRRDGHRSAAVARRTDDAGRRARRQPARRRVLRLSGRGLGRG